MDTLKFRQTMAALRPKQLEVWKPVVGFEGLYEVSSWGQVRDENGQPVKVRNDNNRYRLCYLPPQGGGTGQTFNVARLELEAFRGPPLPGQECRHLNDVRWDNRLENLRWGSKKQQVADARRNRIRVGPKPGHHDTDETRHKKSNAQKRRHQANERR